MSVFCPSLPTIATAGSRACSLPPQASRLRRGLTGADQAFQLIRKATAVVTASLHATIFAYVAGVPFLAVAATAKIGRFLVERGLGHRLLSGLDGLHEKRALLHPASVDWQSSLTVDRQRARAITDRILAHVDEALSAPPKPRREYAWLPPTHPVHTHTQAIALHAGYGERIADLVAHEIEIDRERPAAPRCSPRAESGSRTTSRLPEERARSAARDVLHSQPCGPEVDQGLLAWPPPLA